MKFEFTKQEVELIKEALTASSVELLSNAMDEKLIKYMGKEWSKNTKKQSEDMIELINKIIIRSED